MSTYFAKAADIERKWYVIDAAGLPLGRVATEAARLLRGKHKPTFTPNVDTGDHVIILNAEQVVLTGNKLMTKIYRTHSGYPGGLKEMPYKRLMQIFPQRAVEHAIKGMLPHNSLGAQMFRKLKVYRGAEHPHLAQKPEVWAVQGKREGGK
ncbi:ribosomal protein uL13 [Acididesulfobacillus acetoxydans]|uniref:Large ribosomal subunit protein uL13 n=1 Tax=Acididesulfobacillus acetoxydans TaxID=1561005 RepID=A0A8S0XVB5_9FIRM|nr:50S ribosomal protein L13 [Acididesulfobacillus acetoxydans]CAA7600187.1 ribosomal protein uL13 [Acididesulfobacillus acetoxydans]CEJ09565.1 50S ribosomal protein L13 [Acididesulfobacillus acetoxydans]